MRLLFAQLCGRRLVGFLMSGYPFVCNDDFGRDFGYSSGARPLEGTNYVDKMFIGFDSPISRGQIRIDGHYYFEIETVSGHARHIDENFG